MDVTNGGSAFAHHWETDAGPILTNPSPTYYSSVTVRLNNYGYRYIRVRAENACGYSGWVTRYFDLVYQSGGCGPGGGGIGFAMQYSPNPVAETLTVEIEQDEKAISQSSEYTVSLNDKYGKLVYSNKSTALCHEINMKSLEKGLYRLVVEKDGEQHIAKIYKE
ncbi:T9SS type A sorting domain-containing protein [Marivirga sp.]|uniref:T9SS type A sorting domain-containing protein n=1 Tax=Marivirga sp. TaxID=2018662 RepID=UPI003DA6EF10